MLPTTESASAGRTARVCLCRFCLDLRRGGANVCVCGCYGSHPHGREPLALVRRRGREGDADRLFFFVHFPLTASCVAGSVKEQILLL